MVMRYKSQGLGYLRPAILLSFLFALILVWPAVAGNLYVVRVTMPACKTIEHLDQAIGYQQRGDEHAFQQFMLDQKINGQCELAIKGEQWHVLSQGWVKWDVQKPGTSGIYYTYPSAFGRQ